MFKIFLVSKDDYCVKDSLNKELQEMVKRLQTHPRNNTCTGIFENDISLSKTIENFSEKIWKSQIFLFKVILYWKMSFKSTAELVILHSFCCIRDLGFWRLEASLIIFRILIVFIPYFFPKKHIPCVFPSLVSPRLEASLIIFRICLVFIPNFLGNSTSHPL